MESLINNKKIVNDIYNFLISNSEIPNDILVNELDFRINQSKLTSQDDLNLYSSNREYANLYDKSEAGVLSTDEEMVLKTLYNEFKINKKAKDILFYYMKYKDNQEYQKFIKFIDVNFIN